MKSKIKVTVCVVTYNQEQYIEQCLQSIVDQKGSFELEVVVGDDCSTDTTKDIVYSFSEKYSNIIRLIHHEKNVGAYQNFIDVHEAATGKYVCHIDGDDYMLPNKLQTQVAFMESNPICNLTWHRMLVERNGVLKADLVDLSKIPVNAFSRSDILKYITIGMNSSKMYRLGSFDFKKPDFPILDYFANVEQVGEGYASFISDQPLGVYRAGIGIASSGIKMKKIINKTFRYFIEKYPQHTKEINQAVLVLLLASLKNFRFNEVLIFSKTYFLTFKFMTFFRLFKEIKFIKTLRLP